MCVAWYTLDVCVCFYGYFDWLMKDVQLSMLSTSSILQKIFIFGMLEEMVFLHINYLVTQWCQWYYCSECIRWSTIHVCAPILSSDTWQVLSVCLLISAGLLWVLITTLVYMCMIVVDLLGTFTLHVILLFVFFLWGDMKCKRVFPVIRQFDTGGNSEGGGKGWGKGNH